MQRRKFLGTIGFGVGATALPMWLSTAFRLGDEVCPTDPVKPAEPESCEPAPVAAPTCSPTTSPTRKPTLVLVIPEDDAEKYERGHAFGELFNHGSDAQLALLAPFDVICRPIAELEPELRAAMASEPLMIVLDEGCAPLRLDAALPNTLQAPGRWEHDGSGETWEGYEAREDRRVQDRIELLAGLLAKATTSERLVPQAARELAALPCREREALERAPETMARLGLEVLDQVAASALLAIDADRSSGARLQARLAAAVRARLTRAPISGAPWARGGGCGEVVEGDEARGSGIMSGMGHVPRRSTRFLKFYTSRY